MTITKRTGRKEAYARSKIERAIGAAFKSVGGDAEDGQVAALAQEVEDEIRSAFARAAEVQVETIQDLVERSLMARGRYAAAKNFILYRDEHAKRRELRNRIAGSVPSDSEESRDRLYSLLKEIQDDFPGEQYALGNLAHKYEAFRSAGDDRRSALSALTRAAVELTVQEAPRWEYIAGRLALFRFRERLAEELDRRLIRTFAEKVAYLAAEGLYGAYIPGAYAPEELDRLARCIDPERDKLLTYSAQDLLLKRYAIKTRDHEVLETPQELFLGIALHLAMNERQDRELWVKRFYDMLSLLQVTVATPTLSNARKPFHQLSSCFIDTVPDSLDGIYRSIDNFAQVSKFGGGMGLYFGKVRASGGPIRGFQGVAGGVIRWIKLANDTAVAVDQLGVRQGSVAVYLDAWHKDLPEFLQLKTNNGDDRMKAHDVFPAVCYPDLFWRTVRDDIDAVWHLLCPHEVLTVKGYALEDSWGEEWEKRYRDCVADPRISKREIPLKDLVRLIVKSAVETGTPFAFNRDAVNRLNPNSNRGTVYSSNLCTEIAQTMSPIELARRVITTEDGETVVVETTRPGDFVVCNLASLVLGNIDTEKDGELEAVVGTAVRALDNVIDLNFYPVPYAEITNRRYRALGLGVSGYHHALAKRGLPWESEEHLSWADELFERISYAAISASAGLAEEKGAYPFFSGSDWETGAFFDKRGYRGGKWDSLRGRVSAGGMRNGYLLAVAPTSSTSIVAGTTAGIDPVMKRYYLEEKKGITVPRVAPELSSCNFWLYKHAHHIDQAWSLRAAGIRQRHIDQGQSLNLYITTDFSLRQVLDLYLRAWQEGVKTIYYIRAQALQVEECESCAS